MNASSDSHPANVIIILPSVSHLIDGFNAVPVVYKVFVLPVNVTFPAVVPCTNCPTTLPPHVLVLPDEGDVALILTERKQIVLYTLIDPIWKLDASPDAFLIVHVVLSD